MGEVPRFDVHIGLGGALFRFDSPVGSLVTHADHEKALEAEREKVERLEENIARNDQVMGDLLAAERERSRKLAEALEWYADPANYEEGVPGEANWSSPNHVTGDSERDWEPDEGWCARTVLQETSRGAE